MTYGKTYLPKLKTHVINLKRDAKDLSRDLQGLEVHGKLRSKTLNNCWGPQKDRSNRWHMTLKTSDNLLRKHQQSTEKEEERIVAATILFLSTESNICSLLYLGCSGDETT